MSVIQSDSTHPFPLLLLEPDTENAANLAARLDTTGFKVLICDSACSACQALETTYFFALIVVADLTNRDCLATLDELRRQAPRSWMIVAAPDCDADTCSVIHRHGGDACIVAPISSSDLADRLDAFERRARPSF